MERLEDEADLERTVRSQIGALRQRGAAIEQRAGTGMIQRPEHLEQRGFARATLPHNGDEFPSVDPKIHPA